MKTYEFSAKLTTEGKIEFPYAILKQLPPDREINIIVRVNEPTEEEEEEEDEEAENAAWHRLAVEQFFAGYSEEDAIYDKI